jgi:hypothetical protein
VPAVRRPLCDAVVNISGLGGSVPRISELGLVRGDRVLWDEFGEDQLIDCVNELERAGRGIRAVTRSLPHAQAGEGRADQR